MAKSMLSIGIQISSLAFTLNLHAATAPAPLPPLPSAQQIAWHKMELVMFNHFGLKTYIGNAGTGNLDVFNPTMFDANQWVTAAKAGGFKQIILTAKHDDGFCEWPTATTTFGVKSTPWKAGKGDIVKELADACHAGGMRLGLYCAPHTSRNVDRAKYPNFDAEMQAQLNELCSNYGFVDEFWFDGYQALDADWHTIYRNLVRLQPNCVMFQPVDAAQGFDSLSRYVRWPGNENGDAGDPNWCFDPVPSGLTVSPTARWYPPECDVSIQNNFNGNWYWTSPGLMSLSAIQSIYLTSVGRGGVANLNVPANTTGLIDAQSIVRLQEFKAWVDSIALCDMSPGKSVSASNVRGNDAAFGAAKAIDNNYDSYWATDDGSTVCTLTVDLGSSRSIRMFEVQEYIPLGQRVAAHAIQTWNGSQWTEVVNKTTIGYKRIHSLNNLVTASKVRLIISKSRACPLINSFGIIGTMANTVSVDRPATAVSQSESFALRSYNSGMCLELPKENASSVEIIAASGKTIRRYPQVQGTLALTPLPRGAYLVRIVHQGKMEVARMIVPWR